MNDNQVYAEPKIGNMAASVGAQREPKAVQLLGQIHTMENVVERLCAMRDILENGNSPQTGRTADTPAPFEPTVANVLNEGPQILQGQQNRMMDVIAQIEGILF